MKISVKDIAIIGMMVAVIEVCKLTLSFLPNIELTTFWIIIFTLYLGRKVIYVVPVFIIIEGMIYGFVLWWVMYLYVWPLLVLIAYIFRKNDSVWFWSILSGVYGLFFGLLCSLVYIPIGAMDGGIVNGLKLAVMWWIAGIPWDIVHCVGNFALMLVLYKPVKKVMKRINVII